MSIPAAFSAAYENNRQAHLLIKQLRAELVLAKKESASMKERLAAETGISRDQQKAIARLTGELAGERRAGRGLAKELDDTQTERDRLREAAGELLTGYLAFCFAHHDEQSDPEALPLVSKMRAALAKAKEPQ